MPNLIEYQGNVIDCYACGKSVLEGEAVNDSGRDNLYCPKCAEASLFECNDCSSHFHNDFNTIIDGENICESCKDDNYIFCDSGEHWANNEGYATCDNETYCEDCTNNHLSFCDRCEDYCQNDDTRSVNDDIYCERCFDRYCFSCSACGENGNSDNRYGLEDDNYCESCYGERAGTCDECGETVHSENLQDIENEDGGDQRVCRECHAPKKPKKQTSETFKLTNGIKRHFGVEIECFRPSSQDAVESEGFSIGPDGSIKVPEDDDETYNSEEHRTGIFQGDTGINALRKHCDLLQKALYNVNKSCGLHVHVDAQDLNADQLLNITSFVRLFDNLIFALMPRSRRVGNTYCEPLQRYENYRLPAIKEVAKKEKGFRSQFKGLSRYKGFNIQAFWEHGTIEFRYHSGTINAEKIQHWIILCLAIVENNKDRTWLMIDQPLKPSLNNLKRFLTLLRIPQETKTYWLERYAKFNPANSEAKDKKEKRSRLERLLDMLIQREAGNFPLNNIINRELRSLISEFRPTFSSLTALEGSAINIPQAIQDIKTGLEAGLYA